MTGEGDLESDRSDRSSVPRPAGDLAGALEGADVVVCCGSGGVGKTTIAAVLGLQAARAGERVVVVTIDPARRLADALGLTDGLQSVPQRVDLSRPDASAPRTDGAEATDSADSSGATGELWAMMLDTAATFDELVRQHAADDAQAGRILENRFYRNIAGALSGTQEYMAAETLHQLHGDPRFDRVIVDTPPSRHALDFLEAPGVLARFLDHRLFKLLMLPARRGMRVVNVASQPVLRAIGRVVGSDVLVDAVAFFQAFAGMEAGFRERADDVLALLRSEATRFVLVASPRHDTMAEAVWFAEQLHRQDLAVAASIVNRVQPTYGPWTAADAGQLADAARRAGDPDLAALWLNVGEMAELARAEHEVIEPLASHVGGVAPFEVPLLDDDIHDLGGLDWIRAVLFPHHRPG